MRLKRANFFVRPGETFQRLVRWEVPPLVYKAISNIGNVAPARITATGHGVPDGWRVAVQSVIGMDEINARNDPLEDDDFIPATLIDANTLDLNSINAADFAPYVSGGYVVYHALPSFAGCSAQMVWTDPFTGDVLLTLSTGNSRITLDDTAKTIALFVSATDTQALTFTVEAEHRLTLTDGSGVVTPILRGNVILDLT